MDSDSVQRTSFSSNVSHADKDNSEGTADDIFINKSKLNLSALQDVPDYKYLSSPDDSTNSNNKFSGNNQSKMNVVEAIEDAVVSTEKEIRNKKKNYDSNKDWTVAKKESCSTSDSSDETDNENYDSEDFSETMQSSSHKLGNDKKDLVEEMASIVENSDGESCSEEEVIKEKKRVGRPPGKAAIIGVGGRKSERLKSQNTFCTKKYQAQILKRLTQMLKKDPKDFTIEELTTLKAFPDLVPEAQKRLQKRKVAKERVEEIEEPKDVLDEKCEQLAKAIKDAKYLVIYTGAGISTAAQIPDYRGPNGIWTRLQKGESLDSMTDSPQNVLSTADPTVTHLALKELHRRGIAKHIVSQNCDGLHLRSGIPKTSLSEVHGNMYIEVCPSCNREYVRNLDVTENTRRFEHRTGRNCYNCGSQLKDTVVHFGERGSLRWPLNWAGAEYHVDKADTILCLGSSLKVLRRYPWLWCMDRPAMNRPKLFIVNLQWTPKDQFASLKIHGKCDEVMTCVMKKLEFSIPPYNRAADTIFTICTPLNDAELDSKSSEELSFPADAPVPPKSQDLNNYIRFEPVFRQPVSVAHSEEDEEHSTEESSTNKNSSKKRQRVLKGNGNGWLGNAWGVKPKKRKVAK